LERATFSNIENQDIDYAKSTIRPWAVRWEQAINQRLLGASEEYYAEHLLDGLMRGDLPSRYAAYAIGRNNGWLNVDEIRALENMNPLPEGKGQGYLQALNMVELGAKPEPIPPDEEAPVTDEEKEQAARALRRLRLIRRS